MHLPPVFRPPPPPIDRHSFPPATLPPASILVMDSSTIHDAFPAASLFCNDRFLVAFQLAKWRPYSDSKTLVDLPLRVAPSTALARFLALPAPLTAAIAAKFLADVFHPSPDAQIVPHTPTDLTASPPTFVPSAAGIGARSMRAFACDLKRRWGTLCRRDAGGPPDRSSLIPLPHPFFVPGGRFREAYYWDTLWVVHGLLACDMVASARDATRNLLSLVSKLGFVPNGARVYYLNRSQPPMLPDMVAAIADRLPASEQAAWLAEAVPLLDREHNAFDECRRAPAPFERLSVYRVRASGPRPESFAEDFETADEAAGKVPTEKRDAVRRRVYADMAAGAESGWDFSSRWLADASDLSTIRTSEVVPVCLNATLLRGADLLRGFHTRLAADARSAGDGARHRAHIESAARYRKRFDARAGAMKEHLWDGRMWRDAHSTTRAHTPAVSAATFMPLWAGAGAAMSVGEARAFMGGVEGSGLVQAAGVASTTETSGQQWDFPNMWAPLVDFAVEGLRRLHEVHPGVGAGGMAKRIARGALKAMHAGWTRDGAMFEKYDVTDEKGTSGGGGEYEAQDGFGWTNGVALKLMHMYAEDIANEGWLE